eukprot:1739406-Alexandrium_andersonii.AAC.1
MATPSGACSRRSSGRPPTRTPRCSGAFPKTSTRRPSTASGTTSTTPGMPRRWGSWTEPACW